VVYEWHVGRTKIDIDDDASCRVMDHDQLKSKRDAVNLALRILVPEAFSVDTARVGVGRRSRGPAHNPNLMVPVDTSAWIEVLRGTDSSACGEADWLLGRDDAIAVSDLIRMEVLAGARDEQHLRDLRGLLARARVVTVLTEDFDTAATLYRTCRSHGDTVRKPIACMIAATVTHAAASRRAATKRRGLSL